MLELQAAEQLPRAFGTCFELSRATPSHWGDLLMTASQFKVRCHLGQAGPGGQTDKPLRLPLPAFPRENSGRD